MFTETECPFTKGEKHSLEIRRYRSSWHPWQIHLWGHKEGEYRSTDLYPFSGRGEILKVAFWLILVALFHRRKRHD